MTSSGNTKQSPGQDGAAGQEPVYLASQLASICDVDLKTIHNWCDRDESTDEPAGLESYRTQGGHLRFKHSAVLRFLTRWGYPIPDELLQDRPHVLMVESDREARAAIVRALHLVRPGDESDAASGARERDGDVTLGLWSTPLYYLHLWDDPYAALISLGERTGAAAPPDLAVLSLPMSGLDASAWIHVARSRVGEEPPHVVLVTAEETRAAKESGVVATVLRSKIAGLGAILDSQAKELQTRVQERATLAKLGRPRRRVPIAPKEPIFVASQVASIWDVDLKTVHNWVEKGDMEAFRTPGRHLRFRRRSLLSFLRRYNKEIPGDLASERPRVMVVDTDAKRAAALREQLGASFEVVLQTDAVAALGELGLLSAGAGLVDGLVVALPAKGVDEIRWLSAVQQHPDTRYTRVVTVGGDTAQQRRWQELGVIATVEAGAIEQVTPVLEQVLGLQRR